MTQKGSFAKSEILYVCIWAPKSIGEKNQSLLCRP